MRRFLGRWIVVLVGSCLVSTSAAAQTVDEILAANLAARGGRQAQDAVTSVRQTSLLDMAGGEATAVVYARRPNLLRQDLIVGGETVINAFDGTTAWVVNPLVGVTVPTVVTGAEAASIRRQAGFEGPLQAARAAGDRIELLGRTTRQGRPVYDLRLTSDTGHQVRHAFVDVETGLEVSLLSQTDVGWFEEQFSDYRDVQGLRIPFAVRTALDGRVQSQITVTDVRLNEAIDPATFALPVAGALR